MKFLLVNIILALIALGNVWMATRPTGKSTDTLRKDGE